MPHLGVSGSSPAVNGQVYNDPDRDPEVSSLIWEIRKECRIELIMESFRLDDLKRWSKFNYVDRVENTQINQGAWVVKTNYPDANLANLILTEGDQSYIVPSSASESLRTFDDPRVYVEPIPLDQITLYSDHGVELDQNPD